MYTRVCKWSIPNISTIYFQSQVLIFKTHTFNHFPTFSSTSLYSESSITLHEESPSEATMPAVLLWALILPPTSGCARGSWAVAISNPKGYSWIYWQVYKSEDGTWESSETQSEPQPITVQNQDPIFLGLLSAKSWGSNSGHAAVRGGGPTRHVDLGGVCQGNMVWPPWSWWFNKEEYQDGLQKLTNASQRMTITEWLDVCHFV